MADHIEYLTKDKFESLKQELESLKTVKRREVAENLEYAKSLGDLSENAEYHEAREQQAAIEDRIQKLEDILSSASIVKGHDTSSVGIGSVVNVDLGKSKATYTLVSSEEVDVGSGKISAHSPLGEALAGKKKGDAFQFRTPGGVVKGSILSIE